MVATNRRRSLYGPLMGVSGTVAPTLTAAVAAALVVLLLVGGPVEARQVEVELSQQPTGAFVLHGKDTDPYALKDNFMLLSEKEQLAQWSDTSKTTLEQIASRLEWFEYVQQIDVKLIGFDRDGAGFIGIDEEDLEGFFVDLLTETTAHFINGPEDLDHTLTITADVSFSVVKSDRALTNDINDMLASAVTTDGVVLPYTEMDTIIGEDYLATGTGYTIYLINPMELPMYTYSQTASAPASLCGTNLWVGGPGERYAWIDFGAGPLSRGPKSLGEGATAWFSLPDLATYLLSREEEDLMTELAGIVWKAARQLVISPSSWFPLNDYPNIEVHIIEVTDRVGSAATINAREIEDQVAKLVLPGQSVSFITKRISFEDCIACSAAFRNALTPQTHSRVKGHLEVMESLTLDSKELEAWLESSIGHVTKAASTATTRVIPVVVFDLNTEELVLLDGREQAATFPDFVVGVQTQAGDFQKDFMCNDQTVVGKAQDASQAIFASLLQTGWGIAPTYAFYQIESFKETREYMWSVGNSPFGPFSESKALSFSQVDAAYRAVIFSHIDRVLEEMNVLFDDFERYDGEVEHVLSPSDHSDFVQRWNVFDYKLEQAALNLAVLRFDLALFYVRSLKHEVQAMHDLIGSAGASLKSEVECVHDAQPSSVPFVVVGLSGAFGLAVLSQIDFRVILSRRSQRRVIKDETRADPATVIERASLIEETPSHSHAESQ